MQLAGSGGALRAVRNAVDHQPAHPADALAAIVIERDWVITPLDQTLVDDIQHFQERHIFADIVRLLLHHPALGCGILLAPDMKGQVHHLSPWSEFRSQEPEFRSASNSSTIIGIVGMQCYSDS